MPEKTIGPFELIEEIGSGGMATVIKAYQPKLDRHVAIKMMHKTMLQDTGFLARFEREARIIARLDHPNIVPLYDYDKHEDQPYLAMKYIEGATLKEILNSQALSLEDIQELMTAVADALTYAHEQGILHRDVKPSNIIIDNNGHPYLMDFGLARIAQQGESTLSADSMVGTPHYISPEQAQGLPDLDARTDVYSFGIVLYELVTGTVPFTADSAYAIVHKHIYAAPTPPSQLVEEVPPAMERVLLKALSKEPDKRYGTPNELMAAFKVAISSTGFSELDESRIVSAPSRIEDISEKTPGGGKYVSIPTPHPKDRPTTSIPNIVSDVKERFQEIIDDLSGEMRKRGVVDNLKKAYSDSRGKAHAPVTSYGDEKVKLAPRSNKHIRRDWGSNDRAIRYRVNRRMRQRWGLFIHALFFTVAISAMFITQAQTQDAIREYFTSEAFLTANPNVDYLAPLADVNYTLFFALTWGGGLIGHFIQVIYNSGRRLENKRRALYNELVDFHGEDWQEKLDDKQYKKIRRRVDNRFKARAGLMGQFFSFLMTVMAFVLVWPPIHEVVVAIPDKPVDLEPLLTDVNTVPLILGLIMGIPLIVRLVAMGLSYIIGTDARRRTHQREYARERELSMIGQRSYFEKEKPKHTLDDDIVDESPPAVRMTADGEFTQSFVEEIGQDENSL